jgi:hypothetical protein
MRKEFREEWARLNPIFVRPEDSAFQTVRHAIKETLHGFFAPFLMFVWILKSALTR